MKRKSQSTLLFKKSSNSFNSVRSSSTMEDTTFNNSCESEPLEPKRVAESRNEVSEDLGTLDSGPSRPILDKYVRNAAGRCFHSEWYTHYEWLEYIAWSRIRRIVLLVFKSLLPLLNPNLLSGQWIF